MDDWKAAYSPILGTKISVLAWCPLWCYTPDVVSGLNSSSLTFSGGALMVCDIGAQIFLTWTQVGRQFCLVPSEDFEACWQPRALDRIHCGREDPWFQVHGARLDAVRLYVDADDENRLIVGARHELNCDDETITVWIGTGDHRGIGDHDDLWVSIDQEPINLSSLVEVCVLRPCR